MKVASLFKSYKPVLWDYGESSPGSEARWKLEKWTDDNGDQFYEFHNDGSDRFMTIDDTEPSKLETTRTSFYDGRSHQNLFKIEGPQGSQTITSKNGGFALMVTADAPHGTYISVTNKLNIEGGFYKWRILCA